MEEVEDQKIIGCGKIINPYRTCGDISFANKLILCKECLKDDANCEGGENGKWWY